MLMNVSKKQMLEVTSIINKLTSERDLLYNALLKIRVRVNRAKRENTPYIDSDVLDIIKKVLKDHKKL